MKAQYLTSFSFVFGLYEEIIVSSAAYQLLSNTLFTPGIKMQSVSGLGYAIWIRGKCMLMQGVNAL